MAQTLPERRGYPRVHIDGPMQYRQVESHDFLPGQIENISASGALVWISEALPLDSEIVVRLEPDGPDETWADLVATLVNKLPEEENSLYGYGCSIELA
ncbi:MAG: PilZ domain-containing protein [Gammaproteobacteria bacterium]|nr:PilZ domain-containing protein [Gammaproteobacteria bacterium]